MTGTPGAAHLPSTADAAIETAFGCALEDLRRRAPRDGLVQRLLRARAELAAAEARARTVADRLRAEQARGGRHTELDFYAARLRRAVAARDRHLESIRECLQALAPPPLPGLPAGTQPGQDRAPAPGRPRLNPPPLR
ncbi:hypothetical protein [Streptomyces sp. YIM 98790]|uniref:hypothetical protein n=1 Tax=Streptomyces sp. YIM 98790 TaxID=2689077 RepID=UPI00140E30E3|nr:hypothetical protein [Streptomyces sp. YIM 98790]